MSFRAHYSARRGGATGGTRGRSTYQGRGGCGRGHTAPRSRTPTARAASAVQQEPRIPAVDFKDTYHVDILRPYPSETGGAFVKRSGARQDLDLIDPPQMAGRLSYMNYEGFNRPGRSLSFMGASYSQGHRLLATYEDKMEGTGMPALQAFFKSRAGKDLLNAMAHLDASRTEDRDDASVSQAIEHVFEALASDELTNSFKRLNLFAAHMYNFSAQILQAKAALHDRNHWADQLSAQVGAMPPSVRNFIARPDDDQALVEAMRECFMTQVLEQQPRAQTADPSDPLGIVSSCEVRDNGEYEDECVEADHEDDPLGATAARRGPASGFGGRAMSAAPQEARRFGAGSSGRRASLPVPVGSASGFGGGRPKPATIEAQAVKWTLKELNTWKVNAGMELTKQNFLALEARAQKELLEGIPSAVRKAHGLPTSTADIRVLERQQDKVAEGIVKMVAEVVKAWTLEAEMFNNWRPEVSLDEELLDTLAAKLHHVKKVPTKFAEEVTSLLDQGEDKRFELNVCTSKVLQELLPEAKAFELFELAHEFAHQYAKEEPGAKAVQELILLVPEALRSAVNITSPEKYVKIKSKHWKSDVSKIMTLGYVSLCEYGMSLCESNSTAE